MPKGAPKARKPMLQLEPKYMYNRIKYKIMLNRYCHKNADYSSIWEISVTKSQQKISNFVQREASVFRISR